jgi:hypothetical protein
MLLSYDVRSVTGSLLIARGHTVTDQLIERLVNLGPGAVREPLFVIDVEPDAPSHKSDSRETSGERGAPDAPGQSTGIRAGGAGSENALSFRGELAPPPQT